jgi:hypothetical protein
MMLNFELYVDSSCLYLWFFSLISDIKRNAKDAYPDQSYFCCSHLHHPWIQCPLSFKSTTDPDIFTFTILQITDIHLGEAPSTDWGPEQDRMTYAAIDIYISGEFSVGNASAPTYANAKIDMYPTTDEYDNAGLKESEVIMPDGSYAKFFSSVRPNVVLNHFEWMATYGITGVFHHRFMLDLHNAVREKRTMVLRNVSRARRIRTT